MSSVENYPSLNEECPPGGARTLEVGRSVITHPPFILAPVTKALADTAFEGLGFGGEAAVVFAAGVLLVVAGSVPTCDCAVVVTCSSSISSSFSSSSFLGSISFLGCGSGATPNEKEERPPGGAKTRDVVRLGVNIHVRKAANTPPQEIHIPRLDQVILVGIATHAGKTMWSRVSARGAVPRQYDVKMGKLEKSHTSTCKRVVTTVERLSPVEPICATKPTTGVLATGGRRVTLCALVRAARIRPHSSWGVSTKRRQVSVDAVLQWQWLCVYVDVCLYERGYILPCGTVLWLCISWKQLSLHRRLRYENHHQ